MYVLHIFYLLIFRAKNAFERQYCRLSLGIGVMKKINSSWGLVVGKGGKIIMRNESGIASLLRSSQR
jgi:hypothetical protein